MIDQRDQKAKGFFIVLNEKGLHTRPAAEFVRCASQFKSNITLRFENLAINGKSILGILMLAAARGSKVCVEADGEDAEEAVRALLDLSRNRFYITY
ncbi:MAG: HPr family phosphocarrier protein [Verrucomicrobia bacterium]|nr:HPr family phosphocarrier protein [Verrucomicrobiota bacterium]NDE62913.1 HPr family phosphocarrier protein [Chlamydiota bacterium]